MDLRAVVVWNGECYKYKYKLKRSMHSFNNAKIKRSQNVVESNSNNPQPPSKNKHRVILNESANRKHEEGFKNITRKSIDVTLIQPTKPTIQTLYQPTQSTKPYYRRPNHNARKGAGAQRYEE